MEQADARRRGGERERDKGEAPRCHSGTTIAIPLVVAPTFRKRRDGDPHQERCCEGAEKEREDAERADVGHVDGDRAGLCVETFGQSVSSDTDREVLQRVRRLCISEFEGFSGSPRQQPQAAAHHVRSRVPDMIAANRAYGRMLSDAECPTSSFQFEIMSQFAESIGQ